MSFLKENRLNLTEILLSAFLYLILFYMNQYIFQAFEDARGVNWVFVPSGLRLCLTLIFGLWGALGLALASFVINCCGYYGFDFVDTVIISMIGGFAPLIARDIVVHGLKVNLDLSNISCKQLMQAIGIYALLSSGMHQLWFMHRGLQSVELQHIIAMFIGDIVGSLIFIGLLKLAICLYKNK
jgi:hypothetical protein